MPASGPLEGCLGSTVTAGQDETEVALRLLLRLPLETATRWLDTPHGALEGATPRFAIALGQKAVVLRIMDADLPSAEGARAPGGQAAG